MQNGLFSVLYSVYTVDKYYFIADNGGITFLTLFLLGHTVAHTI